jgi:hypothetical protein
MNTTVLRNLSPQAIAQHLKECAFGAEAVERIRQKAKPLQGLHVTHVNSTYYGGGVAMLLDLLTSLINSVGIKTDSRSA